MQKEKKLLLTKLTAFKNAIKKVDTYFNERIISFFFKKIKAFYIFITSLPAQPTNNAKATMVKSDINHNKPFIFAKLRKI